MSDPRIARSPLEIRAAIAGRNGGLVPTMGALHEGHCSLIRRSAAENPLTVVSIFVNPTQFTNAGDLAAYPRDLAADAVAAFAAGADLIYAPTVDAVYPAGYATSVEVSGLTTRWEGEVRPGHFKGVATVVTLLLNAVRPARAYFGEKDYQQLQVVRRMARDLLLPGEIVACETIRDEDGLALSSRNVRLSPAERETAALVPATLFAMRDRVSAGIRDSDDLISTGRTTLAASSETAIEYLAIVDPQTLEPQEIIGPGSRALLAVRVGETRLIDNLELLPPEARV